MSAIVAMPASSSTQAPGMDVMSASGPYTKGAPGGIDTAYPWVYGLPPARTELRAPWLMARPSASSTP